MLLLLQEVVAGRSHMSVTPYISAATGVVTLVGGFVGYLVKTNNIQNTRLTVLEASLKSLTDANLNPRLSVVEQGLQDIRVKVGKLDLLENMKASLDFLNGQMRDMQTQIVPRSEHQAYWKRIDDKIEDISERKKQSDEMIEMLCHRN